MNQTVAKSGNLADMVSRVYLHPFSKENSIYNIPLDVSILSKHLTGTSVPNQMNASGNMEVFKGVYKRAPSRWVD